MTLQMSNEAFKLYWILRKALAPDMAIDAMVSLGFEVDKTTRLVFSFLDELHAKESK